MDNNASVNLDLNETAKEMISGNTPKNVDTSSLNTKLGIDPTKLNNKINTNDTSTNTNATTVEIASSADITSETLNKQNGVSSSNNTSTNTKATTVEIAASADITSETLNKQNGASSSKVTQSNGTTTIKVEEGDTLSQILYEATGDGTVANYEAVAKANGIDDPNKIYAGQTIEIDNSSITNQDYVESKKSSSSDSSSTLLEEANSIDSILDGTNTENTSGDVSINDNLASNMVNGVDIDNVSSYSSSVSSQLRSGVYNSGKSIVNPPSINEFNVNTNYSSFLMAADTADKIDCVCQASNECRDSMLQVINILGNLKNVLGVNVELTDPISNVVLSLDDKSNELKDKYKELIEACRLICNETISSKNTYSEAAKNIATELKNIQI